MNSVSDSLLVILSQYELVETIAKDTNGRDLYGLGRITKAHWAASIPHMSTLTKKAKFGLRCEGDGEPVDRTITTLSMLNGRRPSMTGPRTWHCLDKPPNIPGAQPCAVCRKPVCNNCRFHFYTAFNPEDQVAGSDLRFADEVHQKTNSPAPWHLVGYRHHIHHIYQTRDFADLLKLDDKAESIIADSWRVYCPLHVKAYKAGLRKLGPLPGPLCTCNPLDRFVGRWICMACFELEFERTLEPRNPKRCCEKGCRRLADLEWKQCVICQRLKEPYRAKGHNAVFPVY